jgi:hypothetical protein
MTNEAEEVREEIIYVHCGLAPSNRIEQSQDITPKSPAEQYFAETYDPGSGAKAATWLQRNRIHDAILAQALHQVNNHGYS